MKMFESKSLFYGRNWSLWLDGVRGKEETQVDLGKCHYVFQMVNLVMQSIS